MKSSFGRIQRGYVLALILVLLPLPSYAIAATTPEQVKSFVRQVYFEGVPYEEASQLSWDIALPVLQGVLNNPSDAQYWANAVVTIGMIGDDQGAKLLMEFIERDEAKAKLNRAQTVAKTSAVMALGYIVNKTGNEAALAFLTNGVEPNAWQKRGIGWTGSFHRNVTERDSQLASMAVLGLGVSGNAEAAQALLALKQGTRGTQAVPGISSLAEEALTANEEISTAGLRGYYRKMKDERASVDVTSEAGSRAKSGIVKPNTLGEVLREPQAGEQLRSPQPGEIIAPAKTGEILKPLQEGQTIKVN